MALVRYEAFVLTRHPLTESSWIVSLFTREAGKVRAVAKGGRQVKSPFRGALEPFGRVRVDVAAKEGADLGQVRTAELDQGALDLFSDWARAAVLFGAGEVLERGLPEHSREEETWRLVGSLLDGLRAGAAPTVAWPWFLFWFLRLHGVLGVPKVCGACATPLLGRGMPIVLLAAPEGWVCSDCAPKYTGGRAVLEPSSADLLLRFSSLPLRALAGQEPDARALKILSDALYAGAAGFLGRPLRAAEAIGALYVTTESKA